MAAHRATLSQSALSLTLAISLVGFFGSAPAYAQGASISPIRAEVFAQDQLLRVTNADRLAAGLPQLTLNDQLHAAAQAKAADMLARGYWDHFRPSDRKAPWDFISEEGYDYRVAGENLARGFKTPEGITKAWMDSPTHRANLLSSKYTDVGFASVYGTDDQGKPVIITVQLFGAR